MATAIPTKMFRSLQSCLAAVGIVLCLKSCLVVSELLREPPGCLFPDFLQSTEPGLGDWTWKYDGDTHIGKVRGGVYTICSNQYKRDEGGIEESCLESQQRRKCVKQHGPNLFSVQHDEFRPTYQCIRFIVRSPTVIQLAVSDRRVQADDICTQNLTLDHSPWISINHYKTAVAHCPFSGGFNFQEIYEYTRDHFEKRLCRNTFSPHKPAPVRIESDCIEKEGFHLSFKSDKCIPEKSFFSRTQKLVCMASWQVDGDGFTLLRKENERSFYCVRVAYQNLEVTQIVIYLDWECYRRTDLTGLGGKLSYSTPYVIFRKAEKRIISLPCSDELSTCGSDDNECQDMQCMRTCEQCLNSTGYQCEFDEDVVGSWVIRQPYNTHKTLNIHKHALHHSNLGILKCVTFNKENTALLRAIVWGTYQNGCYPRFVCMYYDTPATSIMRFRMSNVLQWPLELTDESICDEDNFLVKPDFNNPKDTYEERPWDIALHKSDHIHRMTCIYPIDVPDYASFVDQHNRTGCITLRSRSSPKTITMLYVHKSHNPYTQEVSYLQGHHHHRFQCIAAMTYISSLKTVVTLTQGREREMLCWMIADQTLVVVNTASCNRQTAMGILRGEEKYFPHLKWRLDLNSAGEELEQTCREISQNNEKEWLSKLVEKIEEEEPINNTGNRHGFSMGVFSFVLIFLCIVLS